MLMENQCSLDERMNGIIDLVDDGVIVRLLVHLISREGALQFIHSYPHPFSLSFCIEARTPEERGILV